MLGFPNRADQAVLSGGAWVPTLPLQFLQTREIGEVARTTNTALASTQFTIDLGRSMKTQVIALRNHNLSITAEYRVIGSLTADFALLTHDSGWRDVWPVIYPYGTLEWEDDNWWTGKYTQEEREGYTTELDHLLPAAKLGRYWRVEIKDVGNPAGYVQVGRLFIGPAWQPKLNMIYGAAIGWETKTEVQEAKGGAEYFDVRTPYRAQRFTLAWMDQDEAFTRAFELLRQAGIHAEILFIHDPADTVHALRRRYMGRLRTLSPIEYPYFNTNSTPFEIKELL
jgi:hypothetical protein